MSETIINTRELLPCLPADVKMCFLGPIIGDHNEYGEVEVTFVRRGLSNAGWELGGPANCGGLHFLDQDVKVSRHSVICLQDQDEDWYVLRLFSPWADDYSQQAVLNLIAAGQHPLLQGRIPVNDDDAILNDDEIRWSNSKR